jgi:hypothetical protein
MYIHHLQEVLSFYIAKLFTLTNTRLRLPEDDVYTLKHVGVLTIYKILLIYMLCICFSG